MSAAWLARVAASALVRRLVYLAVALVIGYAGMADAHAATEAQAIASCTSWTSGSASKAVCRGPYGVTDTTPETGYYQGSYSCSGSSIEHGGFYPAGTAIGSCNGGQNFMFDSRCPSGSVDYTTKTCVPEGPSDEECQAINAEPGFIGVGATSRPFASKCMANGCMFGVVGPSTTVNDPNGISVTNGQFEWTGACAAPPPVDAPTVEAAKEVAEQTCTTEGQGDLKLCVKRNGEHCLSYPSGTGKQQCWTPGEVGEKTSGEYMQKRNAGTVAEPPARTDVTPVGTPKTTTTTKQPQGTVIQTTVTNYITNDGTDAGPDEGEPADGSGDDDEEQPGSVTDDGTCDTQPAVTGGDPLLANIILQTWGARCAQADDNAVTTTGGAIDDCSTPWAITGGTDANVAKLQAMRKSICPDADDASAGKGAAGDYGLGAAGNSPTEEEALRDSVIGGSHTFGAEGLDDEGMGFTRTCPQMPIVEVLGTTVDFNLPAMCDWMQMGGQLVLLLAALASLRIIGTIT